MGKRYKGMVQYDGTRYRGWQSQKDTDNTIQGKIEQVLSRLDEQLVEIQGSGRTDAGVHARGQVISFSLEKELSPEEILRYVNHYLPQDIGFTQLEEADGRFHARLNATGKTYVYRIWNSSLPNVFDRKWMYTIEQPLDLAQMRRAAEYFLGSHDFAALCAVKKKKKSTVRTIYEITIEQIGHEVQIRVRGNGFLHHMVRILVGTLVEVGMHQRSPQQIPQILQEGIRSEAGITMPAQGLILWEVDYTKK